MTKENDMTKRNIIIAIVAILAVAAVPFVYAQQGRMHMHHGGDSGFAFLGHLQKLKSTLDLSDQQVDAIKAIVQDAHTQNAQYRDQLRSGHLAIAKALIANPNDLAAAQALLDQQTAAEKVLKSNMLAAASKALNVLTPEQRSKLGTLIAEHEARER
jgi:Spy/CpxP family protein refolding chaperone